MKIPLLLCSFALMAINLFPAVYYIGAPGTAPGGTDPQFGTLKAACDFLNSSSFDNTPSDTLYITSDLTEPAGVVLTAKDRSPIYNEIQIVFAPYEGVDRIITFTDNDTLPFTQIGWSIVSYDITITGLTIQGDASCHKNILPLSVIENRGTSFDHSPIYIVNNRILYKSQIANADSSIPAYAVQLGGQTFLENCLISADYPGVSPYSIGVVTITRSVITGNNISAKHIGIRWRGSSDIVNNFITVNQDTKEIHTYGLFEEITSVFDLITGNRIILSQNNHSKNSGATGIYGLTKSHIADNVISGFFLSDSSVDASSRLTGIENINRSGFVVTTLVNNTIIMDDVMSDSMNIPYKGFILANNIYHLRHNTFMVQEDDFASFCIDYKEDSLNSDSNDFNLTDDAFVGIYKGTNAKTLTDWQLLSGQDMNSGFMVAFSSPTGVVVQNHPVKYELQQNYPNPFNPVTTIKYQLPTAGTVTIKLFDILGNEVKTLVNDFKPEGNYEVKLDASGLSSGTYIYRLIAGSNVYTRKMVLLK